MQLASWTSRFGNYQRKTADGWFVWQSVGFECPLHPFFYRCYDLSDPRTIPDDSGLTSEHSHNSQSRSIRSTLSAYPIPLQPMLMASACEGIVNTEKCMLHCIGSRSDSNSYHAGKSSPSEA